MADLAALDEDHSTADASALAAAILSPEDILANEWVVVRHVRAGDDMSGLDRKSMYDVNNCQTLKSYNLNSPAEGVRCRGAIAQLNEESILSDI